MTRGDKGLQAVTRSYKGLHGITRGDEVTSGENKLQRVQRISGGDKGLQGATKGYSW